MYTQVNYIQIVSWPCLRLKFFLNFQFPFLFFLKNTCKNFTQLVLPIIWEVRTRSFGQPLSTILIKPEGKNRKFPP